MSFTTEVKKEILSNEELSFCCKKALMLGILHGSSTINLTSKGPKLVVKSYILNAIKLVSNYIKTEYEISAATMSMGTIIFHLFFIACAPLYSSFALPSIL